ncbi:MAG: transglutaminase-like domain-containing protein [Bacilli bacterium]|nr:transglutaminase-like domain-containing protein [Bacilli bacterium]
MNRTSKLLLILCILVISFAIYIFYINFNVIMKGIDNFIDTIKDHEVVIPEDTKNHRIYNYKTVSETNDFNPKNMNDLKKIYYTILNNGWNEFTFYCDKKIYPECANDVKVLADNNDYVSLINNFVSPYNQFQKFNTLVTNDKIINIKIDKLYTDDEISITEKRIGEIFKKLNVNTSNPTRDDIKLLHNYLIKNITYDTTYTPQTIDKSPSKAYFALTNGKAICSGYSDSFAIMMDKLNIPNFKVSTIDHVWNVIYFENKWQHIDVTWDDDEINNNNYYNFFMVDTNTLLKKDTDKHLFNKNIYLELK